MSPALPPAGAAPASADHAALPAVVVILVPQLDEGAVVDPAIKLSNEYGKVMTVDSIATAVREAGVAVVATEDITLTTISETMARLIARRAQCPGGRMAIINLCDGTETDGYAGITAVAALESHRLAFTGADRFFYDLTTSKPELKRALQARDVQTAVFCELRPETLEADMQRAAEVVGFPMIVKPAVSYASLAISDTSVVHDVAAGVAQARRVMEATDGGVFVETFLSGREYTVLVTGSAAQGTEVYAAAERVFDMTLPVEQRMLAYDRYWFGYDLSGAPPDPNTLVCQYALAPAVLQKQLQDLARAAYLACGGTGYGRVDIRQRTESLTSEPVVLEVNANCGLSFGPGCTSSVAEIIHLSGADESVFIRGLLKFAAGRYDAAPTTSQPVPVVAATVVKSHPVSASTKHSQPLASTVVVALPQAMSNPARVPTAQ